MSLDDADYAALNALASKSDVSLSWVIRQAIQRFLREHGVQSQLPLALVEDAAGKRYRVEDADVGAKTGKQS